METSTYEGTHNVYMLFREIKLKGLLDMKNKFICFVFFWFLSGCIVVPEKDVANVNRCEISSDRKTLKIINGFGNSP